MEKLLILSDVHYPLFSLSAIARIVRKEKPDNLLLLGDNIELELFKEKEEAYEAFLSKLDKIFPLSRSFVLLGDNDYVHAESEEILSLIDSFSPMNKGEYFFLNLGNMYFFHGNLENSKIVEKIGYHFVKVSRKIHEKIAPILLSYLVRFYFGIPRDKFLFLGHLHYLGTVGKTVFCGTLNNKAQYFSNSLGYVTVIHSKFNVQKHGIVLHHTISRKKV